MLPGSLTPADFQEAFAKNCNGVAKSKYSRMGKAPQKGRGGWIPSQYPLRRVSFPTTQMSADE